MKQIVLKWYRKLQFPAQYDEAFLNLLNEASLSDLTDIEAYDESAHTAQENLLAYLYFCEALEKRYREAGIEESVLLHTLSDLVIWTNTWFSIKNEVGLAEPSWVKRHMSFRLFRLGRLQFCFGKFWKDYPSIAVKNEDDVLEVHIPADGSLDYEECTRSFALAKAFFKKHFPSVDYRFYSCDSWLLDDSLRGLLGENANICRFGARFSEIDRKKSDRILRYVFRWDTTRENLSSFEANTRLEKALKSSIENGATFYEVLGVIPVEDKK